MAAIGEVTRLSDRDSLTLLLRGEPDGSARVTVRDRWSVEHYLIDAHGALTRPTFGRAAPAPVVS